MSLPPKGDPRRPLHLAIRSTRILAIIFLFVGGCLCTAILVHGRRSSTTSLPAVALLLFYFGSGVAYLMFSIYLKRRQFWAVLGSLILASIQLLFTIVAAVSLTIITLTKSPNMFNFSIISLNLLGIVSVILALAQLIYHLALSFEAIKHVPVEEQRGFEPLMIQPINNSDTPPSSDPS
jgi:hypothetical protein